MIRGLDHAVTLEEAKKFFASLNGGAMIIKALAGGGGRGTRAVLTEKEIDAAFQRCQSEAQAAFGRGDVYVEEFIPRARHVEVQILGDAKGGIAHLGERECSVQRRFQKIVEIAPAPAMDDGLRQQIIDAAVRFARSVGYTNLGTFEFLVDVSGRAGAQPFVFIEANARLQVEHTVTEEVTGVDLVQSQIRLAQGATLKELGLDKPIAAARLRDPVPRQHGNDQPDGSVRPGGGTLAVYEAPNGPGVRTDGFGYAGYQTSGAFDSLLAKVIAHSPSPDFAAAVGRETRALSEFRLEGVATNIRLPAQHPRPSRISSPATSTPAGSTSTSPSSRSRASSGSALSKRQSPPPATPALPARGSTAAIPLALFAHDAAGEGRTYVDIGDR